MDQVTPKAGEIWEVLLDNGDVVNLRRRKTADLDGKWDTLDSSILPCRVYGVRKKIIDLNPSDAPLIMLCNKILLDGLRANASDICIEPTENNYIIMFKVDGIFKLVMEPKTSLEPKISARYKMMSSCDISVTKKSQEGHINFKISLDKIVCFHIKFIPTPFGEKIMLQVLKDGDIG